MSEENLEQEELEQSNEINEDEIESEEVEETETESEDEGESEDEKPKAKETPKDESTYLDFSKESLPSEQVKKRIDADTKHKYKIESDLKTEREKRLELEKKILELEKPKEVAKPNHDLAYESPEKYDAQVAAHYESIKKQEEWNRRNESLEQQALQEKQSKLQEVEAKFLERAVKNGFTQEQMNLAADSVALTLRQIGRQEDAQKYQDIFKFVMTHDYGDKVMDSLSKDSDLVREVISLDPMKAALKINDIARSFQAKLKSKTPPPDEPLKGSGAKPEESQFLKGATFS
ncbi:MAG: hypothetical protein ACRBCS_03160 [Cellvibrionaceae bacterium]